MNWPLTPAVACLRTCVGYAEPVCARCPYPHVPDPAAVVREARGKAALIVGAAAVLAPSGPERDRLLAAFPVPPGRVHVAPGWIDMDRFAGTGRPDPEARRAFGFAPEAPVVLYVARIFWMKGLGHLAEAIPGVLDRHPAARFVFAGPMQEPEEERVHETVRRAGVDPERLLWTGNLPQDDLARLYRAADVFALPSPEIPLPTATYGATCAAQALGRPLACRPRPYFMPRGVGRAGMGDSLLTSGAGGRGRPPGPTCLRPVHRTLYTRGGWRRHAQG